MLKPSIRVFAVCAASWPLLAVADSEECRATAATNAAFEQRVREVEEIEKSGRTRDAFDESQKGVGCPFSNSPYWSRLHGVRERTSFKLGEDAEKKGDLENALKYFRDYNHGMAADRVQYKIAGATPDHFQGVSDATFRLRGLRDGLRKESDPRTKGRSYEQLKIDARAGIVSAETAGRADPDLGKRISALDGYLGKLAALARDNGERFLAVEAKAFAERRNLGGGGDTGVQALNKARDWLSLIGQEKRADERAVQRGNELLKDDSRKALEAAIAYFGVDRRSNERNVRKVQERARQLGDANLAKGEKEIAADYYGIAGLDDKSRAIVEKHEAESAKAEVKRQKQFKKEQKDLEKELGL